jgi:oxygen-independent coproporphyrinogen-3 oxidase
MDPAERDLERAFALQPAHVSHYQLTLEPNTVFAARPPAGIPDDDASWDMQEHCQALLAAHGYAQYEVSAYARPGRQCAHNVNYWRYGDYLGIGAGAHGKLTLGHDGSILRRWKIKHPAAYLASAGRLEAIGGDDRIEPERRPFEFMLNALRLVDGFDLGLFTLRTGLPVDAIAPQLHAAVANGWLAIDAGHARPTDTGRRFTNDLISLFL